MKPEIDRRTSQQRVIEYTVICFHLFVVIWIVSNPYILKCVVDRAHLSNFFFLVLIQCPNWSCESDFSQTILANQWISFSRGKSQPILNNLWISRHPFKVVGSGWKNPTTSDRFCFILNFRNIQNFQILNIFKKNNCLKIVNFQRLKFINKIKTTTTTLWITANLASHRLCFGVSVSHTECMLLIVENFIYFPPIDCMRLLFQ